MSKGSGVLSENPIRLRSRIVAIAMVLPSPARWQPAAASTVGDGIAAGMGNVRECNSHRRRTIFSLPEGGQRGKRQLDCRWSSGLARIRKEIRKEQRRLTRQGTNFGVGKCVLICASSAVVMLMPFA
jgi:hypothetical protein